MADSSIDDDLFGDGNEGAGAGSAENNWDVGQSGSSKIEPPPPYIEGSEFSEFIQDHQVQVDSRYGYACVMLYRPFYFPGQTVRGLAFFDLFNDIPAKDVMIRVKGREVPGKHGD